MGKRLTLPMGKHTIRKQLLLVCGLFFFLLTACTTPTPPLEREALSIGLVVDGQTRQTSSMATTVREYLEVEGVALSDLDEVTPPLFTPLTAGMTIEVTRIEERLETVLKNVPFEIQIVRSDAMQPDDPPQIIQAGKPGVQEETVRLVYRDGVQTERIVTQIAEIEPAQPEIRMVGVGVTRGDLQFAGVLGYINGGTAVILRGSTLFPEQLEIGGQLDGRVFQLSPHGDYLLYTLQPTVALTQTGSFSNTLWTISTERGALPQPLNVGGVLWAGWNPAIPADQPPQIAYTTANPTNLPPGWEANNDLWVGNLEAGDPFEAEQRIEAYPASYAWWGGNFVWSPTGDAIAYAYADEVGVIPVDEAKQWVHTPLQRFTDYNTRADWVWVPTLAWSPNGRYLSFTQHATEDPSAVTFDSWVADVETGITARFVPDSGIWSHWFWSPDGAQNQAIAYLQAVDTIDSLRSGYVLRLLDVDGSNGRQLYPPLGQTAQFPREWQSVVWSPTGQDLAFIYDNALHLYTLNNPNPEADPLYRITQDDVTVSHPTWAPYGAGLQQTDPLPETTLDERVIIEEDSDEFLPEE